MFKWDRYLLEHTNITLNDMMNLDHLLQDIKSLRITFLCLLLIPTLIQVQTHLFLVQVIVQFTGTQTYWMVLGVYFISFYYTKISLHCSWKKCYFYGQMTLQSLAFVCSIFFWKHLNLGGPLLMFIGGYCISSAFSTELVTKSDDDAKHPPIEDEVEWFNQIIRLCLRLTLRDVLYDLSDNVAQDEMLQLAMLRWIVDYWAYNPTAPDADCKASSYSKHEEPNQSSSKTGSFSQQYSNQSAKESDNVNQTDTTSIPTQEQQQVPEPQPRMPSNNGYASNLTWEDLYEMLSTTTGLMETEVHYQAHPTNTTATAPSTSSSGSIENLQSLLASINVNEQAKPTVLTYKKAIQSFPPSHRICEGVATVKKCPAMFSFLVLQSFYNTSDNYRVFESLLLLPFMCIEMIRILDWFESIHKFSFHPDNNNNRKEETKMDRYGMTLLLTTHSDHPHRPISQPTLLQVWFNLQRSCTLLEHGVKGIQCVQTSMAARDFCNNVVSLAGLGVGVYQKGWVYGVGVLASEALSPNNNSGGSRYRRELMGVIQNGGQVIQNLAELVEEHEQEHGPFHPVVNGLLTCVGKGWMWGQYVQEDQELNRGRGDDNESTSSLLKHAIQETITLNQKMKQAASVDEDDDDILDVIDDNDEDENDLALLFDLTALALERNLITEVSFL